VSHRPLATVSGLTIGDYLLWTWSLNANHDVLSLVSGLTLPPLAIALVWLLAVTVVRLLARSSPSSGSARSRRLANRAPASADRTVVSRARGAEPSAPPSVAATPSSARASRKIAA
jgi:hypothetical protein